MSKLTVDNNFLTALVKAGADAHGNLFKVNITFNSKSPNKSKQSKANDLTIRCTDFNIPPVSQESYTVKYVTATIERPAAKVNVQRNFTITFRVDSNYEAYKMLLDQEAVTSKMAKSYAATDIQALADSLFETEVVIIKGGLTSTEVPKSDIIPVSRFKHCWITKIDPLSFGYDGATPQTVQASISFLEMEDLQTGVDTAKK